MAATRPVTVAIDAMGGDYAPKEIIKGALAAARKSSHRLIVVGDEARIRRYLRRATVPANLEVLHAAETIEMGENPAAAIRRKPDSSLVVAARLVREGRADAMVSAGSTGASMAVASLILGRAPGIDRPAIATIVPTVNGQCVLLDVGANVNSTVENLMQFAVMGMVYSRDVLGVKNPRIGLLSIGAEPGKGDDLVRAAHKALRESGLNFVGNVEGGPLFEGVADVVVCDGFVGNVALKVAEGVVRLLFRKMRDRLWGHPWYRLMLLGLAPGIRRMQKEIDAAEYGGAPLLGVNGVCIICHGSSEARAISNAINVAIRAHQNDIIGRISRSLTIVEAPPEPVPLSG